MKKIDEVIKQIEQITLQDGNQYQIEIRKLVISKIEQYRDELLDELEKEIDKKCSISELCPIKQKILEMKK